MVALYQLNFNGPEKRNSLRFATYMEAFELAQRILDKEPEIVLITTVTIWSSKD